MSFHVSEGGLEGLLPSPRGVHRWSRAMATSGVTSTISAPTDGTRPLPVRPQSRTPALHRFSGHVSVEAPGRPPADAVCVLRSEIGHQQPLVRRIDEPAVRCWDKLGPFGVIAPLELDPSATQPQFLLRRLFDELD